MIILNVPQLFEDVSGSKRPGFRILYMARLYMQRLSRVPNIPDYGSIRLSNT